MSDTIPHVLAQYPKTWEAIAARVGHEIDVGVISLFSTIGGSRRYHHRPLYTYLLSTGRCLTLTSDPKEAKAWNRLEGKFNVAFPEIDDVFSLKLSGGERAPKFWAIVHEHLFWPPHEDWTRFVDLFFRWRAWDKQRALHPATLDDLDGFLAWVRRETDDSHTRKGQDSGMSHKAAQERRTTIDKVRDQVGSDSGLDAKVKWAQHALLFLAQNGVKFRDFDPSNLGRTHSGHTVITNLAESRSIPERTGRLGTVKSPAPKEVDLGLETPAPIDFGASSYARLSASAKFDDPGVAEKFEAAFFQRNPKLKVLKGRTFKRTVAAKARGSEVASFELDKVILKPEFFALWEKHGLALADEVYAHELGHSVESHLGMDWLVKEMEKNDIDPWQHTEKFPFGEHNMSEAFATSFAVLVTGETGDRGRLNSKWPEWEKVVIDGAAIVGVHLP